MLNNFVWFTVGIVPGLCVVGWSFTIHKHAIVYQRKVTPKN
jgi:hypothetical protein